MKSRITIEVDFNNGNQPVIQILQQSSDDVRDKLLESFTQSLNGNSWLKIQWKYQEVKSDNNYASVIHITPILFNQLPEEAKNMSIQYLRYKHSGVWDDGVKKEIYDVFEPLSALAYKYPGCFTLSTEDGLPLITFNMPKISELSPS